MNILFAASEVYPFIKTGGLGDVTHALPAALGELGDDARIVMPAYRDAIDANDEVDEIGRFDVQGAMGVRHDVRILQVKREGIEQVVYMFDVPALYHRGGTPYVDENGAPWADNAERFVVFSRAVALLCNWLARRRDKHRWRVDIVHCNDWQTGLVPAFLSLSKIAPASVFTIHNLSYDGHYSYDVFQRLGLPTPWWSPDHLEFYHGFSLLKSGMVFSDAVTTVSPTYANEIRTPEYGNRFEGILNSLGDRFIGILNGIDTDTWDPAIDSFIARNYSKDDSLQEGKRANKQDLLSRCGLEMTEAPVLGFIGRLVEQKGIDLIVDMLPRLFESSEACAVILGSGTEHYESVLASLQQSWPGRLHVEIGYDETLAHRIEAGCDIFLMPSMFEPCGLNQMYSLHYGTLPVVTRTGGLADTVIDTTLASLQDGTANGFVMASRDADSLLASVNSALELYANPKTWARVQRNGMQRDFGWSSSAAAYRDLYTQQYQRNKASA